MLSSVKARRPISTAETTPINEQKEDESDNPKTFFQNESLKVSSNALMPHIDKDECSDSEDESDNSQESNGKTQQKTVNMCTDDKYENVSQDLPDTSTSDVLRQSPIIIDQKYNSIQQSAQRQSHCATPTTALKSQQNKINKTSSLSKLNKAIIKCIRDRKYVVWIVGIAILAIICFNIKSRMDVVNTPKFCNYTKSRTIEPIQSVDVWDTLSSGMKNIINNYDEPEDITNLLVSLFTYESGSDAPALVKKIANESNECFGNSMNLVEMTSEDFMNVDDYGVAIEIFKNRIEEGNVMLIAHLNAIPAEAARALHFICDTYNPVVKNIVIFLTLETTKIFENAKKNAMENLSYLWSSLAENELDALITRVTDQVIHIKG